MSRHDNGYKGSDNRRIVSYQDTEKINETASGAVGFFVTAAIFIGLFVGIIKMGEFVSDNVSTSAVKITSMFDRLTDMFKSAVPTVLLMLLLYAVFKARQYGDN